MKQRFVHQSDDTVEKSVIDVVNRYCGQTLWDIVLKRPKHEILKSDFIIKDLHIDPEETLFLVLDIEKKLGVNIPADEIETKSDMTVQELIDLVRSAATAHHER